MDLLIAQFQNRLIQIKNNVQDSTDSVSQITQQFEFCQLNGNNQMLDIISKFQTAIDKEFQRKQDQIVWQSLVIMLFSIIVVMGSFVFSY